MRVSVFGLGYVGCVTAACLADEGHDVYGVDVNPLKVDMINKGQCPVVEKGLDTLIARVVGAGRLTATTLASEAIEQSEMSLVCVGTPSRENGSLDLQYLRRSSEQIGQELGRKDAYHVVVIRSTVLPGTVQNCLMSVLERHSGRSAGDGFGVCVNPEFLREGSSLADFYDPPYTLIGEHDARSGDSLSALLQFLEAPVYRTNIPTAEMVKYANNAFHGLKVAFANEIGSVCKESRIDSHTLMSIFCRDTKLNLSGYYLRPGFAFGGSCLPKDLRALTYFTRQHDLDAPVLESILRSNELHVRRVINHVVGLKKRRVAMLGLSFKAGTDDLRESPIVTLTEALLGKGLELKVYDANVNLARLTGANRRFIEREIPHIASLLCNTLDEALAWGEVVVVGNHAEEFSQLNGLLHNAQFVVDLVRAVDPTAVGPGHYWGICW